MNLNYLVRFTPVLSCLQHVVCQQGCILDKDSRPCSMLYSNMHFAYEQSSLLVRYEVTNFLTRSVTQCAGIPQSSEEA